MNKPEDKLPQRWSLFMMFFCFIFHQAHRYTFRRRSYDDDKACSRCQVQWIA